ncbi:unnamed protein product [Camellia sinensis]
MKELCSAIMQHTLQDLIGFIDWGPPVYPQATQDQNSQSYTGCGFKAQCLKGSRFALSAQATWSLWLIGPLTKIYPDKLRLATIQCFFSCIQSAIWAMAVERNISAWKLGWDLNLLVVAYCGVIFIALTYWLRIWVIQKRGPIFSAAFNPLAFTVTAIFSAFLWKETPHWGRCFGALLLVGGLYGVLWKHKEGKAKPLLEQKSKTKEAKSVEQKSETKEERV